jgi:acyl carrier protein
MDVENKLRELLLPVFGVDSVELIKPEHSLVNDLDLDSLDFIEILHLIEVNFGVVITLDDTLVRGLNVDTSKLFEDGILTSEGEVVLKENFPDRVDQLKPGMSKIELFSLITVGDLANIIDERIKAGSGADEEEKG